MNRSDLGQLGELLVIKKLQQEGFSILEQNYKKFFGEIDIIAQQKELIVFVEVKTRKNSKTSMYELVSYNKQQKIILTALDYISKKNFDYITYRFDVALVEYQTDTPKISYISNAFYQREL